LRFNGGKESATCARYVKSCMTLDHEHKYILRAKWCLKVNSYQHQRHAKFWG